jgi:MazG family protein
MSSTFPHHPTDSLKKLMRLIQTLRSDEGCPWDKEQTPNSISQYLIEEIYELVDAIESGHADKTCEELGDVLFHIFFLGELYREQGLFDIDVVARNNTKKMIRRHPHVFGSQRVDSTEAVRKQWHQIKKTEKGHEASTSELDSVPVQLPALMRAYRISERAARAGFDWSDLSGVMEKVEEEWAEFKKALKRKKTDQAAMEFGDILFTLTNVARFTKIHPESALASAIHKFVNRFKLLENLVREKGEDMGEQSPDVLDEFWQKIKESENNR